MRRGSLFVLVALGIVFLNVSGAAAGWYFNATYDVGGQEVRVIAAPDDTDGDYKARIHLYVPRGVDAEVTATLEDEAARVNRNGRLSCTEDGAEVLAKVKVRGHEDSDVTVSWGGVAVGDSVDGEVGETIWLAGIVPGAC